MEIHFRCVVVKFVTTQQFKVLSCGNFFTTQHIKTVVL